MFNEMHWKASYKDALGL